MSRLPALGPRQVIRALERAGFVVHRVSGSHYVLKRADDPRLRVTVAWHNRDLKPKTLRTIIAQAGLSEEEFLGFL
ncbi:MAG TPA: type II toxin-antitoxin system HicA family toxin [Geminicoccaceae bacterium]|nr:type II toxin-antitoxin system HicA family toxin [Geminicoccaceae bacterium]